MHIFVTENLPVFISSKGKSHRYTVRRGFGWLVRVIVFVGAVKHRR